MKIENFELAHELMKERDDAQKLLDKLQPRNLSVTISAPTGHRIHSVEIDVFSPVGKQKYDGNVAEKFLNNLRSACDTRIKELETQIESL